MSPVTHFLAGWAVANSAALSRRDRALVALAGVAPDMDGAGAVAELATRGSEAPVYWWSAYHHVLCHNIGFGFAMTALSLILARRRWMTAGLVGLAFHLHLLGDLLGGRGPDGYRWPIPYLLPFSDRWQLAWEGQWHLNAWPNFAVTIILLGLTLYWAWSLGRSPLELISRGADARVVSTLRGRFGEPSGGR